MNYGSLPLPFRIAMQEARKSEHKHRVGAVVTLKGRVVGRGFNQVRGHKWSDYYDYPEQYHAETAALIDAGDIGDMLWVVRLNRIGEMMLSKPCPHCVSLIRDRGIKQVHYSNGSPGVFSQFLVQ